MNNFNKDMEKGKYILDTERVQIGWENDKLKIFDSDKNYLDYICEREFLCNNTARKIDELEHICHLQSDYELAMYIIENFCSADLVKCVVEDADFSVLRDLYGTEFVNRIGSVAVVIREKGDYKE